MTELDYRNTQTQVKHEILAKYLDTWGGIIINGLRHHKSSVNWRFVYVDCFAYRGKYAGDQEDFLQHHNKGPVYGSPIIGIQALDKLSAFAASIGINVVTYAILIERDQTNYRVLKDTLGECGFSNRVRETTNFNSLRNREIALVSGDATTLVDNLVNFTNNRITYSFYLLDPYGASGIPYDFVHKIVSCPKHDVMINLIYEDLLRKTGIALKDSLATVEKNLVQHWERAYGKQNWDNNILRSLSGIKDYKSFRDLLDGVPLDDMQDSDILTDDQLKVIRERTLVYGYQDVLTKMDAKVAIKLIGLRFPDKERTMFYLYLTTHDPTGALQLNEILHNARLLEFELRFRVNCLRKIPRGQLSFLDPIGTIPTPPKEVRATSEEISKLIFSRFHGKTLTRKEIYQGLVDTYFFPVEIDNAIRLLRREGRLSFEGKTLNHRTEISFKSIENLIV